jgi:hypothetical protein
MLTLLGFQTNSILVFNFFSVGFGNVSLFFYVDLFSPIQFHLLLVFIKTGLRDPWPSLGWWGFYGCWLSW